MSTSIGDAFLLSSYSVPHKLASYSGGPSKLSNVHATYHDGLSTEGHVLVAAQGDGVHVLDLSTLHPAISHTLGPSTVFTCPAVSRINATQESSQSFVYAVMENVQGINPEERGRTVKVWIDNASGEGSSSSVKQRMYSAVLSHRVSSMVVNDELPDNLLFVGQNGELTITDNEVNVQHTYSPADPNTRLIRSFAFGRRSSFVPNRSSFKQGVVVATFVNTGSEVRLVVLGAGLNAVTVLGDLLVPIAGADIVDITCSQFGFVSILTRSGEWHALQIDSADYTTISLTKASPSISLGNLTFVASTGAGASLDEVSTLSLGSSHVLLVGVTSGASPELALLLWDLQYGVLLASRTLTIPASLNRSKKRGIDVQLASASGRTQQALLILGAKPAAGAANGSSAREDGTFNDVTQRSCILMVPYTVPATSTVANALGRAAAGEKWLNKTASTAKPSRSNLDSEQAECIKAIHASLEQKRVDAADEAFFAWASHVDTKAPTSSKSTSPKIPYSYEFVKQVLEMTLHRPEGSARDLPYSPKIVRHLLEKRCVSSNMISGGLLPALRLRKDWLSMTLALKAVNDIPEDHLVSFLSTSATTPRQREKLPLTDDSAMEVDDGPLDTSKPTLSAILPLCVTYPTSAPALRLALRTHLSDAAAVTSILEVLAEWLRSYVEEEPQLLAQGTKKDLHGALVPLYQDKRKRKDRLPPSEKILLFIQTILDSSFISLLSYPPSHNTLRQILSYIEPEAAFTDDLEQLRGPLEPFVKAHKKMVHEAAHGPEKPDPNVDWRKKRKQAHEQAAIAVGVYQVEELII